MNVDVNMPSWARFLFDQYRYKVAHGGRGGAKSYAFSDALVIQSTQEKLFILCTRSIQLRIRDSSKRIIEGSIKRMKLDDEFIITNEYIKHKKTGSEFIFIGLNDFKSIEGLDRVWIDEAHSVTRRQWRELVPTIRKHGSEIWVSFNSRFETDVVYDEFILNEPPKRAKVLHVNYDQNPFFGGELQDEMEDCKRRKPDDFAHIWLGGLEQHNDAQIFKGCWRVAKKGEIPEPPSGTRFYFGCDWGFSQDPTTFGRCWIDGRKLYIDRAVGGVGVEIDQTPALFNNIEGAQSWPITADSARPETISYMKRNGFARMRGSKKGKNSIKDGIAFMKQYEIIIAPEAEHMPDDATHEQKRQINNGLKDVAEEFMMYSFKVDKQTDKVLPIIVDSFNHYIDLYRYGLEELMRRERSKGSGAVVIN